MWENNRLVLGFCVACGVVASYSLSVYLLILVIILCVYLFIFHYKSFELGGLPATRNLSFSIPSWIKNITTSLMNSYHLSKPLEPESSSRRDSPFATNLHISRRGSCRSSAFTCLDENVDYANRRNGMGVVSQTPTPKNIFSDNIRDIRRRSNYESSNSSKIEDFSTPRMSPCARKTSFNNSEMSNVRRVQTVAGPLLGSPGISKRKANDYGLYVDACSPGLASRIVQYREESASPSSSVWTHQPQYSSPGQFPMVHLSHSPSTLPVLSPLNSQKASRRSVRVKIAPPDPLGSRLFPLSSKNNSSVSIQTDHSTKSVIETLKEISRKRIHSQLEDNDDDAAKRQKRSGPSDIQSNNCIGEGESVAKRTREESPRQQEVSPTLQPAKRIRNNEILSSLSSSRKLLQSGGIKRKTQNLDWSRCSTPVLGKQQKTTSYDSETSRSKPEISSRISLVANKLATLNAAGENLVKSSSKDSKTLKEKERKNRGSSQLNNVSGKPTPETSLDSPLVSQKTPKRRLNSQIEDSPWQKDSPFVTVASPDDVIDDISALEEKREQDRKSRLLSMMTVISGGEPPVKLEANEISKSDSPIVQSSVAFATSLVSTTASVSNIADSNNSEKVPTIGISGWNSKTNMEGSTREKSPIPPTQSSEPSNTTSPILPTTSIGNIISTNPTSSNLNFGFGVSSSSTVGTTQSFNTSTQAISPVVNSQLVVSSSFETPLLSSPHQISMPGSSQLSPMFGSSNVFDNKPTITVNEQLTSNSETRAPVCTGTTTVSTTGNLLFSFGSQQNQPTFGVVQSPTSTASPSTVTTTVPSAVAVTSPPASSTSTSSMFQIRSNASEFGKENTISTAIGFTIPVSTPASNPVQSSLFSKTNIENSDKQVSNNALHGASTAVVFGAVANTTSNSLGANTPSTTISSATPFAISSAASTAATPAPLTQNGLFSFGSSTQQISETPKPTSSGVSGSFGQPATSVSSTIQNQPAGGTADTPKVGGFKFDLSAGKPLFTPTPASATNIFGATGTTNSEQKPFTFGSSKPLENPFASNTVSSTTQQISAPTNVFGSSTTKVTDSGIVKDSIFSFGSNTTAPSFSAPQSTSFSAQPATTSTTSSTGFSFQSASSGFPAQSPQSSTGVGFSLTATTATSGSTFSTPATSSTAAAFSFGSSPAFAPAQQSNLFAFGSNTKPQQEAQQGSLFSFGNAASSAPTGGVSVFGQPSASVTPVQTQPAPASAPSSAFQFGSSTSTQQLPGAFSFGASSSSQPANNSGGGAFPMNAGSFPGAAPAMFSIGSGSTAPRVRSSRSRRLK